MLGFVHVTLAIACLVLGALALIKRKGGKRHRTLGYLYTAALLLANVSALSVYQESGQIGPFHVLAVISLATLTAGFVPAFLRRPGMAWLNLHAYFMSWSYVGLVAAGVAQLATHYSPLPGALAVALPSTIVVAVGALLIHTKVPRALGKLGRRDSRPGDRRHSTASTCCST